MEERYFQRSGGGEQIDNTDQLSKHSELFGEDYNLRNVRCY